MEETKELIKELVSRLGTAVFRLFLDFAKFDKELVSGERCINYKIT